MGDGSTPSLRVGVEDPRSPEAGALVEAHVAFAHEVTPPGHVHAVGADGLGGPEVTLFGARDDADGGRLVGIAALRRLDADHGELKSMHVAVAGRGRGVGRALLDHVVAEARRQGHRRLSLETGTYPAFEPARALYTSAGFRPCPPFGPYTANPHSTCLTLALPRRATGADAAAVADVWLRSRRASAGAGERSQPAIPPPVHPDDEVRAWLAGRVAAAETWVLGAGADVDGVVGLLVLDRGEVDQLYVDPSHTGQGLGSLLLSVAKERSPEGLALWTFRSNTGARRFYARHGFVEVARTDGDNEEGAPDVRLSWMPSGR